MGERERGELVERTQVSYFCARGHRTGPSFAFEAVIPDVWDCPRCGLPAGRDQENPPAASAATPYKTHLAYVRERRTDADAEVLLNEALAKIRGANI
jgi:hypothetical protein